MGRQVNETGAVAGGVVDAVGGGVEAERVGTDEGEAVQSAVAIVGHLPGGSYERHSIAMLIIPEAGDRRKGILRPEMAVEGIEREVLPVAESRGPRQFSGVASSLRSPLSC